MTSISDAFELKKQIWQNVVSAADSNSDKTLNFQELLSFGGRDQSEESIRRILESLDGDGDGELSVEELSVKPYDTQTVTAPIHIKDLNLIDRGALEAENHRFVEQLFERADVDKDGVLSKEEWAAERRMNKTRALAGDSDANAVAYFVKPRNEWDHLRPEDVSVGRLLTGLEILGPDDIPPDLKDDLERIRAETEELKKSPHYRAPPTPEERRAMMQSEVLNPSMSASFVSRLFSRLAASIEEQSTQQSVDIAT